MLKSQTIAMISGAAIGKGHILFTEILYLNNVWKQTKRHPAQ